MKTAIISVGTEILFGQITNTNTVFLSQQLNLLGFDVLYHYTVGDNSKRLKETIETAFSDCNLIVVTGGLGPTEDDLTKETICEVMGDDLVYDEESNRRLEEHAKTLNRIMTPNNYKQAMMPSSAIIFNNDQGTAPGFAIEKENKIIIAMPGPPREMEAMYFSEVASYLSGFQVGTIFYKSLRLFGIGESALENSLIELISGQTDPTIATYAKEGECTVRIASKRRSLDEAKSAVESVVVKVKALVGDYIYSYDDEPLNYVVGNKLIEKGISISCAESCTGGLFAAAMTDVPGISEVFDRGLVTYTYRAKMDELFVKEESLEKFTAVSDIVSFEMTDGLYRKTGSDICVSVTGVAGPADGGRDKPVGLIYIGIAVKGKTFVKEIRMRNVSRKWNRNFAVLCMLDVVNKAIDNNW